MDHQAVVVHQVPLDLLDHLDHQAAVVLLDHQAAVVLLDHLDHQAAVVHQDQVDMVVVTMEEVTNE